MDKSSLLGKQNFRNIAITGASGFIGQKLINDLSNSDDVRIHLLIHRNSDFNPSIKSKVVTVEGDLMMSETLQGLLKPGCTVVNLVYLASKSRDDNLMAINNLADACTTAKIKRLIHCSTAVSVGNVRDDKITEETKCYPRSDYEVVKFEIEKLLWEKAYNQFELTILRPTAVFGPGGQNLLKLANDLRKGNKFINYMKSCLYNRRKMNLVCIDNVVSSIIFLIETNRRIDGEVFFISDDESPINNYREIEKYVIKKFGFKDYSFPRVPLPNFLLVALLTLAGKSNLNPNRVYSCEKLMKAGFKKSISFEMGIDSFADWYEKKFLYVGLSEN